jgi:aspartate/methionine/tyrosine aminotransferase
VASDGVSYPCLAEEAGCCDRGLRPGSLVCSSDELESAGYELRRPEGTFYLWVRSPDPDDGVFANRLANESVLVLPGSTCAAPGFFRISLTGTIDMIERSLPVFRNIK